MKPSSELKDIISGWFEAAGKGDPTFAEKYLSKQMRLVGTDPNEWMEGNAAIEFLKNEAQTMGGQIQVTHGRIEAYSEGAVGWGIANPTITLPNGKQFSPRWSAVFHQEDGEWKIIQIHASVGVPNEKVLG